MHDGRIILSQQPFSLSKSKHRHQRDHEAHANRESTHNRASLRQKRQHPTSNATIPRFSDPPPPRARAKQHSLPPPITVSSASTVTPQPSPSVPRRRQPPLRIGNRNQDRSHPSAARTDLGTSSLFHFSVPHFSVFIAPPYFK